MTKDNEVCGKEKESPDLIVGADKGIANVVVRITNIQKGKKLTPGTATFDQKGCEYNPHVLAFAAGCFDAVLAHHADFHCEEVLRVLRPGGVFISQQMGDRNTQSIFDAFHWGSFGRFWRSQYMIRGGVYRTCSEKAAIFRSLGAEIIELAEYDVDGETLRQDLQELVEKLVEHGLVAVDNP